MSQKCLLFAYGSLLPSRNPPQTMTAQWPDAISGSLQTIDGTDVATKVMNDWQTTGPVIDGFTLEIDASELDGLDELLDTEAGDFVRRLINTREGYIAWVYEYGHA